MQSDPTNSPYTQSKFLNYLSDCQHNGEMTIPSLPLTSKLLGVSISSLREQMEFARQMGFIEVKPKTGIKILDYSFSPSVVRSASYAIQVDPMQFEKFADLRNHIEAAYWYNAVIRLTADDIRELKNLVDQAFEKINRKPSQIPHNEHKNLHLLMYKRLGNAFVTGILDAYWVLYETVGLNYYTDQAYLNTVWQYHRQIVEAIERSEFQKGYQALLAHMDLILNRKNKNNSTTFE